MTNGEKIKEIFPNINIYEHGSTYSINNEYNFNASWWNAEYQESTTKNDLVVREFEEIDVIYPSEEVCIYPEYKGKPYFGIKYKENGKEIVGYGTYNPEVLSQYLRDYFISTTKNDLGVDCISRADVRSLVVKIDRKYMFGMSGKAFQDLYKGIDDLPSVTPQLSSELEKNSKKLEKDFGELGCISRQAVLELIADYDLSMGQVVRGIHALPSVNLQEPRKGHWIYKKFDEKTGITNVHICSKCGCPLASPYKSFCSACGSDNREVEE